MPDTDGEPLLTWTFDTLPARLFGEIGIALAEVAERNGFVVFIREGVGASHVFIRPIRAEDVSMRATPPPEQQQGKRRRP